MIKFTELRLIKFGRFKDYKLALGEGMNLIYGGNESGKSTMQLFIKFMLYGIPTRGAKCRNVRDRERIIPWDETKAAGAVRLNKDGVDIEIYREFGKRASSDVTKVTLSGTGEDYFDGGVSGSEVGEKLLGMSAAMFERTVWIAQADIVKTGRDDELITRLINLIESGGSSEVSVNESLGRLDRQIAALKARDKRSAPGEIDMLLSERRALCDELKRAVERSEQNARTERRIRELEQRSDAIEKEVKRLNELELSKMAAEKIARVSSLDSCMTQQLQIANTRRFQVFKHMTDENTAEHINSLEKTIDESEARAYELKKELDGSRQKSEGESKKLKRTVLAAVLCAAAAFITAAAAAAGDAPAAAWVVCAAAGICLIIFAAAYGLGKRKNILKLNSSTESLSCELTEREIRIKEAEEQLKDILDNLECDSVRDFNEKYGLYSEDRAKIKMAEELYGELLGSDDYETLKREAEELKQRFGTVKPSGDIDAGQRTAELSAEREKASLELAELRVSLGRGGEDRLSALDIRDSIAGIDERLAAKEERLDALMLARGCLSEAYMSVKSDYTPLLNSKTEEIFTAVAGKAHSGVKIADDFTMSLGGEASGGSLKSAGFFSIGAYEQMYMSLRLAVAELTLRAEDTVLFIDDALAAFDDLRSANMIEFLKKFSVKGGRQVLIFTCHRRDAEFAEKLGEINIMEV